MKTFISLVFACFTALRGIAQEQTLLKPQSYTPENFPESSASAKNMQVLTIAADRTQVVYHHDVKYITRDGLDLSLQIMMPVSDKPKLPCIVFIQGSAWMKQNVYINLPQLAQFAKRGYVIAIVEYRPSTVAPFPAQVQDAKTAIRFMRANAAKYHVDADNIFVWGDSSGGHTALMVGLTQNNPDLDTPALNEYSAKVNAVVDYFGPTDITQMNLEPSVLDHVGPTSPEGRLLGGKNVLENKAEAARANPITYAKNPKDVAPILIMHGSKDRAVPFKQSVLLANALEKNGFTYQFYQLKGADHGSSEFWNSETLNIIEAFLRKNTI